MDICTEVNDLYEEEDAEKAAAQDQTNSKAKPFACTQPNCEKVLSSKRNLQKHLAYKHDVDIVWFCCNDDSGCEKRFKSKGDLTKHMLTHSEQERTFACEQCSKSFHHKHVLKRHMADMHGVDVVWHPCIEEGCGKRFKQAGQLINHRLYKHDIGVEWIHCTQEGCSSKFKRNNELTAHLAHRHNIGVTYHMCDVCSSKFKSKGNLQRHMSDMHNVNTTWLVCGHDGCLSRFKQAGNLKMHQAYVHDLHVVWFICEQPGCNHKCKKRDDLKQHMADRHDINITWVNCDQPGCNSRFKQSSHLSQHMRSHHNEAYVLRQKQQERMVEEALQSHGWQAFVSSDTLPPAGHYKREHRVEFECASASVDRKYCRIDFVIAYDGGYVFLEVDEHQHRFGYNNADGAAISCDSKRMANVHTSITMEFDSLQCDAPSIFWLRFNPHAWHVDGELVRILKEERLRRLCRFLSDYEPTSPVQIGYAFYDYDSDDSLHVLACAEFPDAFRDLVCNLGDLS